MIFSALILGLVSSLHCVGMCGPIAMMLPVDRHNSAKKVIQIVLYHLGRISTYALIGSIFGVIGRGFYLAGFQKNVSIVLGVLMIVYVVFPKIFLKKELFDHPLLQFFNRLRNILGAEFKKNKFSSFYKIGFLNGFLPCGMLYVALFGALALQNVTQAILYMIFFGVGTIPLMSLVVYITNFITPKFRNNIQKIIPFVIVFLGIMMILRGLSLDISHVSPSNLSLFIQGEALCK